MFMEFILDIARKAGELSENAYLNLKLQDIEFKNERDIVTSADKEVENYLIGEINRKFPEHGIFAEESGQKKSSSEYCWCIDPIDGTTSFVHDQPFYSISIALMKNGETIASAVNAPRLREIYWAEKGKGAFLNGRKIHVSGAERMIDSVVSTGFACLRAGLKDNNLKYFNMIAPEVRGIRRYGSAAIDLAYVASGRLEAYWELNVKLYDVAAGALILEEAGGDVCDFNGGPDYPGKGILGTNGKIKKEFLKYLSQK